MTDFDPLIQGEAPAPTVTIITPTYNRAHLLPRALDSALRQTFEDFELLVIDDGSTDSTPRLVEEYLTRDPRIRYLVQPENRGVSAARNRGFREGRGRYFALLDSDDEWLEQKLERQVSAFSKLPPEVGLLYSAVETVGPDARIDRPSHRGDLSRTLLLRNVIHGTSSVLLRREAVAATGFFDEGIPAIEDWDYWIRLAARFRIDYLPDVLARYHDARHDRQRKSLIASENREARAWLYRTHEVRLRAAGLAHLFLLESARRHHFPPADPKGAGDLIAKALRVRPLQVTGYARLMRLCVRRFLLRVRS